MTLGFRGQLVGSLLGEAISVEIRGVDYIAAVVTMLLGALAVADVLYLNMRERASEFATLRALGWRERALSQLVSMEGIGMGAAGSVVGATLGLAGATAFTGRLSAAIVPIALAAVVLGTALAAAAAVIPVALMRRLHTAQTLAEE